ncbi:MAG: RluA family pseudouridine synthase [Verrucomicrobiaceae bacterium]|nr:RluA family pseudouridine synthase [Verrucomicrobiaceae bacterium]
MRKAAIANDTRFSVIDETDDYIVVCKPAPLKVHPGSPDGVETLYDGLKGLLAFEIANGGQVSIVNRLDRETSGLTLVAKTAAAARRFGLAMQNRFVSKTYLAIVHGWPDWEQITERGPILRKGEVAASPIWVKQIVHSAGTPCETSFRVIERRILGHKHFSLIEASPHTGRMHQIRVHLAHLGHPIVGDKLYGEDENCYLDFMARGWTADLQRRLILKRQALHSSALWFHDDPILRWESPLPGDLAAFWDGERE